MTLNLSQIYLVQLVQRGGNVLVLGPRCGLRQNHDNQL